MIKLADAKKLCHPTLRAYPLIRLMTKLSLLPILGV